MFCLSSIAQGPKEEFVDAEIPTLVLVRRVEPHAYLLGGVRLAYLGGLHGIKLLKVELAVAGLPGKICTSPRSESQPCPTNQGKGADATVMCALEDPKTQQKYCALLCQMDCDCAQAPFALTCQTSPDLPFGLCAAPVS